MESECPHCGNDDDDLMEATGNLAVSGLPLYICNVCSKEFEGDDGDDEEDDSDEDEEDE